MALKQKAELIISVKGEDGITQMLGSIDAKVLGIEKSTKKAAKASKKIEDGWKLGTIAVNAALDIAGKLLTVGSQVAERMQTIGRSLAIETQFVKRFDSIADAMGRMEAATASRATKTFLQSFATQAQRAGLSFNQIEQSLLIATKAATATGKTTEEVAQGLLTSVVGATDEGFKQLGLHLDLEKTFRDHAKTLGISAEQMNIAQKRAVLLEKAALSSKEAFGDVKIGQGALADAEQFRKSWADAVDIMQRTLLPLLKRIADTMKAILPDSDNVQKSQALAANVRHLLKNFNDKGIDRFRGAINTLGASSEETAGQIRASVHQLIAQKRASWSAAKQTEYADKLLGKLGARLADEVNPELGRLVTAQTSAARSAAAVAEAEAAAAGAMDKTAKAAAKVALNVGQLNVQRHRQATMAAAVLKAEAALLKQQGDIGLATQLQTEADVLLTKTLPLIFEQGNRPLKPPKTRGGGSRKQKPKDISGNLKDQRDLLTDRDQTEADQAQAKLDGRTADQVAQMEKLRAAESELFRHLEDQAFSTLLSGASALQEFGASIDNVFIGGLGNAVSEGVAGFQEMEAMVTKVTAAGGTMAQGYAKAVPGMLASSGKMAAGLIKDTTAQAAVMSAFEAAAAAASFATQDYVGGAMHAASSVMYAVVAGMSASGSKSSGGGRTRQRAPTVGAVQRNDEGGATKTTYVLNLQGNFYGGNRRQLGRDLAGAIDEAKHNRSGAGIDFAVG